MNKKDLCDAIAGKTGFAKKDAEKFVGAFVETVIESLQQDEKVQIVGFGTFEVKNRPARKARNPRTGEEIEIAATKAPVFKVGKALKDSVK